MSVGTPKGRDWFTLAVLCLAQFMLVLDITVVNLALPQMAMDFEATGSRISWVVTAYIIPFGGLLLFGGKLSDAFGARRLFMLGLTVFTAASLLAGSAESLELVIIARALQGIGAAMLSPAALSSVTSLFTDKHRTTALAIWAGLAGAGSAVGVVLGGLLTSGPGWRWIFLINLPVGVVVGILVLILLRASGRSEKREGLDTRGAILATVSMASLVGGITLTNDDENGGLAIILIATSVVAGVVFWFHERRVAVPLVPLTLLASRPVRSGVIAMLAAAGLMVGNFYLLSFLMQAAHTWTAVNTGLAFLPFALGTLVGSHLAGRFTAGHGGKPVGVVSFLLIAIGLAGAALNTAEPLPLILFSTLTAIGVGAAFVSAITAAFTGVELGSTGVISGVVNTAHELGGALGIAILAAIMGMSTPDNFDGYSWGLWAAAGVAVVASLLAGVLIPRGTATEGAPKFIH